MNSQLILTHSQDELTLDDAILAHRNISKGYIHNIDGIIISTSNVDNVITEIEEIFGELTLYDYTRNKNQIYKIYKNLDVIITMSGSSKEVTFASACKTERNSETVWKILLNNIEETEEVEIYMYTYFNNNRDLDYSVKEGKIKDLDFADELYYPYLKTNVLFDQFFTGSENILLLVGEAGLGKSKLSTLALKYAYHNPDKLPYDKIKENIHLEEQFINVAITKSVDVLSNDKFWRALEKGQFDFVIIDDLDYMLTKRSAEVINNDDQIKNAFLNQFLSYTDGVEKNSTKFIITTNQRYDQIDQAVLRKGRLFDILELRKLKKIEALAIWLKNNLDENEFNKIFTSDEILSADVGSEISKRLNNRVKDNIENYLIESKISKLSNLKSNNKISL